MDDFARRSFSKVQTLLQFSCCLLASAAAATLVFAVVSVCRAAASAAAAAARHAMCLFFFFVCHAQRCLLIVVLVLQLPLPLHVMLVVFVLPFFLVLHNVDVSSTDFFFRIWAEPANITHLQCTSVYSRFELNKEMAFYKQ